MNNLLIFSSRCLDEIEKSLLKRRDTHVGKKGAAVPLPHDSTRLVHQQQAVVLLLRTITSCCSRWSSLRGTLNARQSRPTDSTRT